MLVDQTFNRTKTGMCFCIETLCRHTLSWQQLSADKGSIDVLQQNNALLWSHTQQVVQPVIRKTAVTQTHQTNAVTQLAGKGRSENVKHTHTQWVK